MGTIINTISIVIGGILGNIFGKYLKKDNQKTIINSCAVAIMFIGIAGAMEGLLTVSSDSLISSRSMFIVICLALGAIIGEIIDIEGKLTTYKEENNNQLNNINNELNILKEYLHSSLFQALNHIIHLYILYVSFHLIELITH